MKINDKSDSSGICVRCGTCRAVCPVFSLTGLEQLTARGKIALAESVSAGNLTPDGNLDKIFDSCIACGACAAVCPSGVNTQAAILNYRAARFNKGKLERNLLNRTSDPDKLTNLMKLGRSSSAIFFKRIADNSGLRRRFPLPLITADRILPPLAKRFFLETTERVITGQKADGPRTAFFVGCLNNYVYPDAAQATLETLIKYSREVVVHPEQGCCGLISLTAGDRSGAEQTALHNIELLTSGDQPDCLVTACPSCATTIIKRWPQLLPDSPAVVEKYRTLAGNIYDLPQFLTRFDSSQNLDETGPPLKITYHDGCHARFGLKMIDDPRRVLSLIGGIELVEMENPESCCGFGGTFNIRYPDYSTRLLKQKITEAVATEAQAIVTSCPGCRLWLAEGAARFAPALKVYHISQIIAPQR